MSDADQTLPAATIFNCIYGDGTATGIIVPP